MVNKLLDSPRKVRNVKLTMDMDSRLVALCKHLGTNPNSYLVNIVGKAVSQDELQYRAQLNQSEMLQAVLSLAATAQDNMESDDDND